MSFLKLRRLPSARKAWKFFTTTLQKLNASKTIKKKPPKTKPRHTLLINKTTKKVSWPIFFTKTQRKNKKIRFKSSLKILEHHHHHCLLKKPSSPVFIDQLFLESSGVDQEASTSGTGSGFIDEKAKEKESFDVNENLVIHTDTADDMWESLVLASPQMHGINERADEFIAKVRADMKVQDMLARR